MKNIYYLFLVLTLTLTLIGCSSDDDEQPKVETFLEKYEGTRWVDMNKTSEFPNIFKFNSDVLNPLDVYVIFEEQGCYKLFQVYTTTFEIIKNSENEFIIETHLNVSVTDTFTIDENKNILRNGILLTQVYDSPQICN